MKGMILFLMTLVFMLVAVRCAQKAEANCSVGFRSVAVQQVVVNPFAIQQRFVQQQFVQQQQQCILQQRFVQQAVPVFSTFAVAPVVLQSTVLVAPQILRIRNVQRRGRVRRRSVIQTRTRTVIR